MYPGMDRDQQPFSDEYEATEERLANLRDDELCGLAGALVAEFVNRGNDTDTALEQVIDAAKAGAVGSQIFDAMET